MARTQKQIANLKPLKKGELTSEEAKRRGHAGGVKSAQVRKQQKDAKASARYILNLAANGNIKENLETLGASEDEQDNLNALHARLFTMAISGNLDAYRELIKIAGYEPEENRKERESLSNEERKNKELQAKMEALIARGIDANVSMSLNDDDGNSDVVIYLPQIEKEEDLEYHEEDKKPNE